MSKAHIDYLSLSLSLLLSNPTITTSYDTMETNQKKKKKNSHLAETECGVSQSVL